LVGIRDLFHRYDDVFQPGIHFGCHLISFSRLAEIVLNRRPGPTEEYIEGY
jgi:hypothetical protein